MLLSRAEAAKKVGRSPFTIRDWSAAGILPVAGRGPNNEALHRAEDLLRAARLMRSRYRERAFIAGSGRSKRHAATDQIRRRILAGEGTKAIAEAVSCSASTVIRNRRDLAAQNTRELNAQDALKAPKSTSECKDTREQ